MENELYNILGTRQRVILCHTKRNKDADYNTVTYMEAIDEKQEIAIDKSKLYYGEVIFKTNKEKDIDEHIVYAKNIIFYGDINLDSEEDLDCIFDFNLMTPWDAFEMNNVMPSNFNYDTGLCSNKTTFSCNDRIKWFKYNYCKLGKPEKVICYKVKYDRRGKPCAR